MHDCLQLKNASRLSKSLRPVAEAIATRSLPAVRALCAKILNMTCSNAILFLPALFVNVDSGRIPEPCHLDTVFSDGGGSALENIRLAFHSLTAISVLSSTSLIPIEASPELWPHLWDWLDFVHTYWACLPLGAKVDSEGEVCLLHSKIIVALSRHPDTAKLIRSTPGVRRILALGWKSVLDDESLFAGSMIDVVRMVPILSDRFDDKANSEEIVEAAGGSFQHLALTIVQHLVRSWSVSKSPEAAAFAGCCFVFLNGDGAATGRLTAALRSVGFIQTLVTTISVLHGATAAASNSAGIDGCMYYLLALLNDPPGYHDIAQAIKSDFLRVIAKVATSKCVANKKSNVPFPIASTITEILNVFLPRATVHYAVVLELKNALPEAEDFAIKSGFHKSRFSREWENFVALAKTRIKLLEEFDVFSRLKACDNMDGYYSLIRRSTDDPDPLTTRGKSFLRALLTKDYLSEPFFTVFAYASSGGVEIDFKPCSEVLERDRAAQLPSELSRLARSRGRMQMHLMFIYEGEVSRLISSPMRMQSSKLHDGLLRALELVPEGKTVEDVSSLVEESLRSLLKEVGDEMSEEESNSILLIH
ncbi:hypothetical protein B0H11DRAFT_2358213 [Mycena galericulata]|nr:hypothetical protein B0H11DRAFT_2358213 [Mycena galericulata]